MKRICGRLLIVLLAMTCLLAFLPAEINAEGELTSVEIQGTGVEGNVLTAVVNDGADAEAAEYQWYYGPGSSLSDTRIHAIDGAVNKTWTVSIDECAAVSYTAGKFCDYPVWVKVTLNGKEVSARAFIAPGRNDGSVWGAKKVTDTSDIFTVDGQRFILLDSEPKGESGAVLVLSADAYGTHAFDSGNSKRYSTARETNIGYWLNNDFLSGGNGGKALPDGIKSYLKNHAWVTNNIVSTEEKGIETTSDTAKLALLSIEEFNTYIGKFGIVDEMPSRWWLRSSSNGTQALCADIVKAANENVLGFTTRYDMTTSSLSVRPVFYLSNEFFTKVKIDAFNTGDNVKSFIRGYYPDYNDLSEAGYTNDELAALGYGVEASKYSVNGTIDGAENLKTAVLMKNGTAAAYGTVSGNAIVFSEVAPDSYDLKVEANEGFELKEATLGGQTLVFADNIASVTIDRNITDLYIRLGKDYGELTAVSISGEPTVGSQLRAVWSPAEIPEEELTFTWGYGPVGFNDSLNRVKEIEAAMGKSVWTANYDDLKAAKGEINDWPIWLRISYKGKTVDSAAFEIAPAKRTVPIDGAVEKSPSQYTFRVYGSDKSFTLLDTAEDGSYFTAANDSYGTRKFNSTASSEYSPTKDGCIAQWLNDTENGFPKAEDTLPTEVLNAIDYNHTWTTETIADNDVSLVQTVQGINLLSMNEYNTYYRRIGVHDFSGRWWLRSSTNATQVLAMDPDKLGTTTRMTPTAEYLVRPVFYLGKDFFSTCRLDVYNTGSSIKEILRSNIDEIQDLYTSDELREITEGSARLTALTFRDSLDQIPEAVQQGTLTARAEFVNTNKASASAVIVIALYNNNRLVDMKIKTVDIAAAVSDEGEITTDSVSLDIDEVEPGYRVSAFVWKNAETMAPMGNAEELKASTAELPLA